MKNVLYISYDGMTDPLGQSQVIPYLIGLRQEGFNFHVLSVEKKARYRKFGSKIGAIFERSGIKWTTLKFTKKPPILSKFYDQWKLNKKAYSICARENISFIHARSYIAAMAAFRVSKRKGTPFLFDMRGFWVDERVDSGLWNLKNPAYRFAYRNYKGKERRLFASSAHIISLTYKAKEELASVYGIKREKISVIPCCVDLDFFDYRRFSPEDRAFLRKKLELEPSQKVLTYLGSLGGWYMVEEMLRFFSKWLEQQPDAIFLLITQDRKELVLKTAERFGIPCDRIRVKAAERPEVPEFLSVSDWAVFFIKNSYSKMASSPTKQGEIMAMGIPIICNDIGDTGMIIRSSSSGVIAKEFTDHEFRRLVFECLQARPDSRGIRDAAVRFFDLQEGVSKYLSVYKKMTE